MLTLTPEHPSFPPALRTLRLPFVQCTRPLDFNVPRVGIVGARETDFPMLRFAARLARECVEGGAIVVSGGALGIDAAAHRGALAAKGRTWLVAPCGSKHVYPISHRRLYEDIAASAGAVVFPFSEDSWSRGGGLYLRRNKVLVALSDVVIAIQAAVESGTSHTCRAALAARKPLWIVPPPPWAGSADSCAEEMVALLGQGARQLTSMKALFRDLSLRTTTRTDPTERAILETLTAANQTLHRDQIADRSQLPASAISVALFTLVLEGLVREDQGYITLV